MLAIIDGDVLAYQACRPRWEKKARIEDGVSYIQLDWDGKRIPLEWTKEEDKLYLQESWENFKKDLEELLEIVYADDFVSAVKGENNFRNLIMPSYKMNRHSDPNKQNQFVPIIRKLAVAEDLAIEAIDREADDLIRTWAEEARLHSKDYIVCSIDKDLRCIPGKHYIMNKKIFMDVSEEQALFNYYFQLLKGDQTDNIRGVPGVGDVKATRILNGCADEEEYQEAVVEQYMLAYGEDWHTQLLVNGRLLHIQKTHNDYFRVNEWPVVKALRGA
jgi:hypothetical protein